MNRSDDLTAFAAAFCQVQAEVEGAKKDSENPHFRSKYADLASIWDACRVALTKHGFSVIQSPRTVSAGEGSWLVEVETMILHKSGQFIADCMAIPVTRADAQGVGSAATYAKRYQLSGMVGVAPEDDDGESAVGRGADTGERKAFPTKRRELARATLKVLGIVQRKVGNDKTKFVITGDDRATYSTFSQSVAEEAKRAQEAGVPVEISYNTTDYGRDIVTLAETDKVEQVPL